VCTCDSDFRFRVSDWRTAIAPIIPLEEHSLTLCVDPSFTVRDRSRSGGGNTSDESAIGIGFTDEEGHLNVLEIVHGRFKGLALPHRVVDVLSAYPSETLKIERNPNFDLLSDAIRLLATHREVACPRIVPFVPITSKKGRIRRIHSLLVTAQIHIHNGPFVSDLLEQAQEFCFEDKQNHRHEDGMLDVIAMLANFS